MEGERVIARDFANASGSKTLIVLKQRCHVRFLAQKLARFRTSLLKKYFSIQFHPTYVFDMFFSFWESQLWKHIQKPRKEWSTSNCQVRLLHETEALRSSSGIAPCTECITSGLKATGSPPSLCSHAMEISMGQPWVG